MSTPASINPGRIRCLIMPFRCSLARSSRPDTHGRRARQTKRPDVHTALTWPCQPIDNAQPSTAPNAYTTRYGPPRPRPPHRLSGAQGSGHSRPHYPLCAFRHEAAMARSFQIGTTSAPMTRTRTCHIGMVPLAGSPASADGAYTIGHSQAPQPTPRAPARPAYQRCASWRYPRSAQGSARSS